ncbi:hypothetical protein [Cysteiniphilum sp. 6C5]|uniref:hypothetical protein n=1 Tax=unclassified Cysteiniphilum TaxID=2610889 RepID=UPI003F862CBE
MKILLFGDYSNYHVFLADGLKKKGYHVDVFSEGDGVKCTKFDIERKKHVSYFDLRDYRQCVKLIREYDIVQFINARAFRRNLLLWAWAFFHKKLLAKKSFMCLVGCDYFFWTKGRQVLGMPLFEEVENSANVQYMKSQVSMFSKITNKLMLKCVKGVTGWAEYVEAYREVVTPHLMVFQPLRLSDYNFKQRNFVNGKLVLFHGIQKGREDFKGSNYIIDAFTELNKRYPDDLECICVESLPYNQYVELMNRAHVLFDQTNCHSFGMNALAGLANGLIVCCGSQSDKFWLKWCSELGLDKKPPILSLKPNVDNIISQVEWMLDNREKLGQISLDGRRYVELNHDSSRVAEKFLHFWQSVHN